MKQARRDLFDEARSGMLDGRSVNEFLKLEQWKDATFSETIRKRVAFCYR